MEIKKIDSIEYLCTHCGGTFKSKFELIYWSPGFRSGLRSFMKCPICGIPISPIPMDSDIVEAVKILREKGFRVLRASGGHLSRAREFITPCIYICAEPHLPELKTLPESLVTHQVNGLRFVCIEYKLDERYLDTSIEKFPRLSKYYIDAFYTEIVPTAISTITDWAKSLPPIEPIPIGSCEGLYELLIRDGTNRKFTIFQYEGRRYAFAPGERDREIYRYGYDDYGTTCFDPCRDGEYYKLCSLLDHAPDQQETNDNYWKDGPSGIVNVCDQAAPVLRQEMKTDLLHDERYYEGKSKEFKDLLTFDINEDLRRSHDKFACGKGCNTYPGNDKRSSLMGAFNSIFHRDRNGE